MSSAWESLLAATVVLASAGPIKQRLIEAYNDHLVGLADEELPREVREDYGRLTQQLSRVSPMRGESAIQATVRKTVLLGPTLIVTTCGVSDRPVSPMSSIPSPEAGI